MAPTQEKALAEPIGRRRRIFGLRVFGEKHRQALFRALILAGAHQRHRLIIFVLDGRLSRRAIRRGNHGGLRLSSERRGCQIERGAGFSDGRAGARGRRQRGRGRRLAERPRRAGVGGIESVAAALGDDRGRGAAMGAVLAQVILARRAQLLFENANAVLQLLDGSRHGAQLALQPVDAGREPGVAFEPGVVRLVDRRTIVDLRDLDARFGGEGGVRAGEQYRGGEAVHEAGVHGERRLFKGVARLFAGAMFNSIDAHSAKVGRRREFTPRGA